LVEARNAVVAMRSDPADAVTLSELVERQAEEFSDRFGVRVDCHVEVVEPLPPRVSVEILRVLQEALNNVRKHASARRIVVRLGYRRRSITLSVRDDGHGFDASARPGYGQQSMVERAQSIGGRLTISSAPGQGTTVTLRVPAVEATAR
jgi:signal transduction histidine kinase